MSSWIPGKPWSARIAWQNSPAHVAVQLRAWRPPDFLDKRCNMKSRAGCKRQQGGHNHQQKLAAPTQPTSKHEHADGSLVHHTAALATLRSNQGAPCPQAPQQYRAQTTSLLSTNCAGRHAGKRASGVKKGREGWKGGEAKQRRHL